MMPRDYSCKLNAELKEETEYGASQKEKKWIL
jgi:hypothetical protein